MAALVLAAAAVVHAADPPAKPDPWRVVVIRSWDAMYPVNVMREQALRTALAEQAPRNVEVFTEEIDPLRFPGAIEADLAAVLKRKYAGMKIDVVVPSGLEPLEFAQRFREDVWPGAAIVFNGVIDGALEGWKRPARTTGVVMSLDIAGSLNLGAELAPNAKRVYLISGTSSFDHSFLEIAVRQAAQLKKPFEIHFLVGLPRQALLERVREIPADSLVMYLTVLRDGAGLVSGPNASTAMMVAEASPVPLLTAIHTQFGRGAVGGSSSRFDLHGRIAGQLVRSVLEGADPDHIPIRVAPAPICEVDWRGLQRWNIPETRVPTRCAVTNRPLNLWQAYFWPIVAMIAIIFAQAALISSLVVQRQRRRRAETQLQARSAEMAQVARMSMVGALTASIAHEINQPIGAILSNAEAAQMMLDQGTLDSDKLREILADIRAEDLRASEVIRGLRNLLSRREWRPVALDVNDQVAEALRHVAFDAARRNVRLSPIFGNPVPPVMGDAVQLQQVVINLVMNAMDAVAEVPEAVREVRIETRARSEGAEIAVSDLGPGLAQEDAERLFHTAFTTKRDGMGFGLSIVHTILDIHRGRVVYEPNVPRGAIFRVILPPVGS
ncbi:MAG TPA: ATP-binding protein [Usitatibacter sp.]|nr:ATP-binding protein [Usitatibacter sp.]